MLVVVQSWGLNPNSCIPQAFKIFTPRQASCMAPAGLELLILPLGLPRYLVKRGHFISRKLARGVDRVLQMTICLFLCAAGSTPLWWPWPASSAPQLSSRGSPSSSDMCGWSQRRAVSFCVASYLSGKPGCVHPWLLGYR